jgi:hypothetical protein
MYNTLSNLPKYKESFNSSSRNRDDLPLPGPPTNINKDNAYIGKSWFGIAIPSTLSSRLAEKLILLNFSSNGKVDLRVVH